MKKKKHLDQIKLIEENEGRGEIRTCTRGISSRTR